MMKLKKLLSLALALGLASSLAACSSQGTSGASPTPAGSDPVPASDTTLNVLIVSDLEPLEPVFQEFAQANGISIQVESVPYSEIFNTIEVRLGTGESFVDVLVADAPLITNYAAKNYLGSMSEYISADSTSRITSAELPAAQSLSTVVSTLTRHPLRKSPFSATMSALWSNSFSFPSNNPFPSGRGPAARAAGPLPLSFSIFIPAASPGLRSLPGGTIIGIFATLIFRRFYHGYIGAPYGLY